MSRAKHSQGEERILADKQRAQANDRNDELERWYEHINALALAWFNEHRSGKAAP